MTTWRIFATFAALLLLALAGACLYRAGHPDPLLDRMTYERELGRTR